MLRTVRKMKRNKSHNSIRGWFFLLPIIVVCWTSVVPAARPGWQRQEVDWRATGGGRIKAIRYPEQNEPLLFNGKARRQKSIVRKRILRKEPSSKDQSFSMLSVPAVMANVIDSPPIDGFSPRIAITVTDKRSDDFDWVAEAHMSVVGRYLTDSPQTNFTIGLFDTGASTHIISHAAANRTGLFDADLITPSMTEIFGATNSALHGCLSPWLSSWMDLLPLIPTE